MIKEYFMNFVLHHSDVTIDAAKQYHLSSKLRRTMDHYVGRYRRNDVLKLAAGSSVCATISMQKEPFCFTYGDGLSDIDINASDSFPSQSRQA